MPILHLLLALTVSVAGHVYDPQGSPVAGATIHLGPKETQSDAEGAWQLQTPPGVYEVSIGAPGFTAAKAEVTIGDSVTVLDLRFEGVAEQRQSLTVSAQTLEPGIDLRNSEVYKSTLFT